MITRALFNILVNNVAKQKVTLLTGARRVGKTELLLQVKNHFGGDALWLNGEDEVTEKVLEQRSIANYTRLLQGKKLLIIDEAQYIPDIGRKAKLMIDEIKPLHIILTGSSSFDLTQQHGEPLVGRSITHQLYPVAQLELSPTENALQVKENLPERLVFGSYPEVITLPTLAEKQQYLQELVQTFLLKDILAFENIRNPQKLKDLLSLIAYQVGKDVSLEELGRQLQLSKNTVERYLDLLTKVYVLYRRSGFNRNMRKEVTKTQRWYFYDNGIRNAVLGNYALPATRQDMGLLWENYILSERIKNNSYNNRQVSSYFWRTYDQQEIDLIEDAGNALHGYEMEWQPRAVKTPAAFAKAYPDAGFSVISSDNYEGFIDG